MSEYETKRRPSEELLREARGLKPKKKGERLILPPQEEQNKGVAEALVLVGGQERLAELLGVSQPMIHKYLCIRCPAERAVQIERLIGVPREKIRPDLFG